MQLSLARVQEAAEADLRGDPETIATGWSIDSRTVAAGDLFIALRGENFDGHDFVGDVLERGAIAAMVSEPICSGGNLLVVGDTLAALQELAAHARRRWAKPVVAVTGSAGKTSTKDIIATLLSVHRRVGKTTGNFNNHVGLPLSLLRIADDAEVAVLEMGMNHAGEIGDLCRIAAPDIGVVTNVGYAHVENFGGIEGIAAAKRELIEALPPNGTAVLNADDPRVASFAAAHDGAVVTYGLSPSADICARDVVHSPQGCSFRVDGIRFATVLQGAHSISNILAGLAVAQVFGIDSHSLLEAVAALTPGKMRGERYQRNGVTILNDAYNSNPEAARHMLDVLRHEPAKRRIAVLGEMRELGALSERLHRQLGAYAASPEGVQLLVGIHGAAEYMIAEAGLRGMGSDRAIFFDTPEMAGHFLKSILQPGDVLLFKGSRGTRVEAALAIMEKQA